MQHRPLTAAELDKTRNLLRKGCQVWEIASHIGRSELAVRLALRQDDELAGALQNVKRGRWPDVETEFLTKVLTRRQVPDKRGIALRMRRTVESVARQIKKLDARNPPSKASPPSLSLDGGLSVSERAILAIRIDHILAGLMTAEMTEDWGRAFRPVPREIWIKEILALISAPVRRILAAPTPPTIADLKSFGWENTSNLGVYAWILRRKHFNPFFPERYVYIGSGTKLGWGLSGRKYQHQKGKEGSPFTLQNRIRQQSLTKNGHFVALLSKDVDASEPHEMAETRRLLVLTEAVLTIWLGALGGGNPESREERSRLRSLGPWTVEDMPYHGVCSHNPLSVDITYPCGYGIRPGYGPES
ncbi:hypothetical protein FPCIR_2323 [Fusarium pseudocircinatum]|uniref:GIY-YIG domain-containing protein n=1 Tax=Fusarium pseudocircinatum TaxID=56676 RepID=A0A8H5PR49_9HYPO|nr:hypothetical protein FPCIR_2323 [Fusarium pseudocircinatum]